jgi:hypothetical protein
MEMKRTDGAHIVNAENVLVRDPAGENKFLLEAFQRVALADGAFADHFDGNRAIEIFVVGLIHAAHAALAQKAFDAIARPEVAARSDHSRIDRLHRDIVTHRHGRATVRAGFSEIRIDSCAVRAVHAKAAGNRRRGDTDGNYRALAQAPQGLCLTGGMTCSEIELWQVHSFIASGCRMGNAGNSDTFLGRVFGGDGSVARH